MWIFGALPSPPVKAAYDRRRAAGDKHAAAHRFLGCLYHCLQTGQTFGPAKAFPTAPAPEREPAAA